MIEIEDMDDKDVREVLARIGYGHLACCRDNHPYVVPIHYAYDGEMIYIYTTEGKKSEIIDANPEVCLQAEEVSDNENWTSVMAVGDATPLINEEARQAALDSILKENPNLTPARSVRWIDSWVRANVEVIYRMRPSKLSGRRTVKRLRQSPPLAKPQI